MIKYEFICTVDKFFIPVENEMQQYNKIWIDVHSSP